MQRRVLRLQVGHLARQLLNLPVQLLQLGLRARDETDSISNAYASRLICAVQVGRGEVPAQLLQFGLRVCGGRGVGVQGRSTGEEFRGGRLAVDAVERAMFRDPRQVS